MKYLVVVCVLIALITPRLSTNADTVNIVANPGFESVDGNGVPLSWLGWNDVWQGDTTTVHSGKISARFKNADASKYLLLTQPVPARIGHKYKIDCWIRTEDVKGDDSGATICMEWSDRSGKFLGGYYPDGFKGTNDWKHLTSVTPRIPDDAANVTVTVYVRKGMTGTAWFDDVSVTEEPDPPFDGSIHIPGYRGVVSGSRDVRPVVVQGVLGNDAMFPLANRKLVVEIMREDGSPQGITNQIVSPSTPDVDLSIPIASLPEGVYSVKLSVYANDYDIPLMTQTVPFKRVKAMPKTTVAFFSNGTAFVNGKPFFPLGVYEGFAPSDPASLTRLKEISDAGFNCVLNYNLCSAEIDDAGKYLDYANKLGLKVIYSVKDIYEGTTWAASKIGAWSGDEAVFKGVVSTFSSHPAILAWYLNDELPLAQHEKLVRNYRWLCELDANHPGYSVLYQVEDLAGYADTTDVLGVDPYPIPDKPVSMVADWTDAAVKVGQPVWVVPQIFDWSVYNKDKKPAPPSPDEMRCMMYLALVHGANGLVPYSYFDLKRSPDFDKRWKQVKQIIGEISDMTPLLTARERGDLVLDENVHSRTWSNRQGSLTIVVNSGSMPATFKLEVPSYADRVDSLLDNRTLTPRSGVVEETLSGMSVRAYRVYKPLTPGQY